jgi:hypothetical protein
MNSSKKKNERLLTGAIITISVIGIIYFGFQAISDNSKYDEKNPFEYNIENYQKSGEDLLHYSEIKQIPLDLQKIEGIAIGENNQIYITGDKSILILNSEGDLLSTITTSETAHAIAIDENKRIFLSINEHIEVYDQEGTKKAQWESLGEESIITSLAVSKYFVFIADAGNHIVWKFDKKGNRLSRIGAKDANKDIPGFIIPSPYFDVSIDPDGFLWVANTGNHSLENYTFDGDLRSSWGEYSMEIEGFCGCCNPSHIAILDDGRFVTSEKGIARVKVYNRLGILESVVAGSDQFIEVTVGLDLAVDSENRIYILDPMKKMVRVFERNL